LPPHSLAVNDAYFHPHFRIPRQSLRLLIPVELYFRACAFDLGAQTLARFDHRQLSPGSTG
jgi:hypothetical protein